MVHEDTICMCMTYIVIKQQTEKKRAFFWGEWNLHPQLDYTFPLVGPHDLQFYQNDSTYKVHEKSYKIKNTRLIVI